MFEDGAIRPKAHLHTVSSAVRLLSAVMCHVMCLSAAGSLRLPRRAHA
eukprot:SAG25_NODE_2398_length_1647_cov_2.271318_2_plen_48_part_00